MLTIFKTSTVVLDCFTTSEIIAKTAPVDFATRHYPEWWKALPKSYIGLDDFFPSPTMKGCVGMIDYYRKSVALPLWSDLAIQVGTNGSYRWQFSDSVCRADVHPEQQRGTYLPSQKYGHLKLATPWLFSTKKDVSWVWSQPMYNFEEPEHFYIPPGVLNFKYQSGANVNLMVDLSKPKQILIPFNQVMAFLTPMTDKHVEIKRHVVTDSEYHKLTMAGQRLTFLNKYRKIAKFTDKFSACPYTKG